MKSFTVLTFAVLAFAAVAPAATISLTPADGTLSGPPGSTVGWGFTLNGDATSYLVVNAVQLGTDPFPVGSSANFTDLLSNWVGANAFALAPGSSLMQPYGGGLGLAEFNIPGTNMIGDTTGPLTIKLDFDLFSSDPFVDGNAIDLGSFEITALGSVNVTSGTTTPSAPEPGTWVMIGGALPLLALARRLKGAAK